MIVVITSVILLLLEYLAMFVVLLVVVYALPAGILYWRFYVNPTAATRAARIQAREPRPGQVRREVYESLQALLLFALYALPLYKLYERGGTAVYWDVHRYSLWWIPASFLIATVAHDVYFYFTHRLMHLPQVFPLMHAGHHRSITPTPWAILSFQPLETISQFAIFAILILFVPLHPAVLVAYLLVDGLLNAGGHCGHEFVPESSGRHWLLKYTNAVTHHDLHHSRIHCNYGQYFNVLDRLMGTFLDREAAQAARV